MAGEGLALSNSRPKRRGAGGARWLPEFCCGIGEMSMGMGDGALELDGELRDMVDANESSRSEERKSSTSSLGRLFLIFRVGAGGGDGTGLKKAISSRRVASCEGVRRRGRGSALWSVGQEQDLSNMFVTDQYGHGRGGRGPKGA